MLHPRDIFTIGARVRIVSGPYMDQKGVVVGADISELYYNVALSTTTVVRFPHEDLQLWWGHLSFRSDAYDVGI